MKIRKKKTKSGTCLCLKCLVFVICLECCVDLICSVVVLIVHVWAVVVMFQSILLCVQPTGSSNAECIVTASQETWSSLPAEPSLQSVSNSRWSLHLVSSSLSVQHHVRGCAKKKPTSTSTSAIICIKTSFTIVQGCSTVSDDNLFPTTNELKGGLIKTNIYEWSKCTCSRQRSESICGS